ncbi:MAG: hypothetical protein H6679_03430 [Epsilonproteobacteria bacterium]|nr:hypothetical protein [Campylobacterota bacterium]
MLITFFITLQVVLLFFMVLHDWLPLPPLNDTQAIKEAEGNWRRFVDASINGLFVFIPLLLTLKYQHAFMPFWTKVSVNLFYTILTIGTIAAWWVPYFFGSPAKHKLHFTKFKKTHHFLPARGDNVTPNTLHVILHLQIWACWLISLYLIF